MICLLLNLNSSRRWSPRCPPSSRCFKHSPHWGRADQSLSWLHWFKGAYWRERRHSTSVFGDDKTTTLQYGLTGDFIEEGWEVKDVMTSEVWEDGHKRVLVWRGQYSRQSTRTLFTNTSPELLESFFPHRWISSSTFSPQTLNSLTVLLQYSATPLFNNWIEGKAKNPDGGKKVERYFHCVDLWSHSSKSHQSLITSPSRCISHSLERTLHLKLNSQLLYRHVESYGVTANP